MLGNEMEPSDTQERLYEIQEKLQTMAGNVPPKYQQRLAYDLLSSLAHVLLENTVFEIVKELVHLQHMTEKHLHQQRSSITNKHKGVIEILIKQQKEEILSAECQGKQHDAERLLRLHQEQLIDLKTQQKEELARSDARILHIIDSKVTEQQSTLEQVGVPGFFVSSNPVDIKLQMYIMGFIVKLGAITVPP